CVCVCCPHKEITHLTLGVCVCLCACVFVCVCARACVVVCVHECVSTCVCVSWWSSHLTLPIKPHECVCVCVRVCVCVCVCVLYCYITPHAIHHCAVMSFPPCCHGHGCASEVTAVPSGMDRWANL